MSPSNLPRPEVKIAYDCIVGRKRQRKIKSFKNPYDARRFWTRKDAQGKNPKIIKGELPS